MSWLDDTGSTGGAGLPLTWQDCIYRQRAELAKLLHQVVNNAAGHLGYLGADFDLRDLPVTSELYIEPGNWRQVKGDPAIRGQLFQQCRVESPMDRILDSALVIL